MENEYKSEEEILYELVEAARQIVTQKEGEPIQEKAAERFAEERNKLRSILDSLDCGITIQDREYNIIFQNKYMRDIFGHIGEKCYRIYEFHEEPCDGCPVELAFHDGVPHDSERRVLMPSGETIIWENTANPLRDIRGNIAGCIEIVRDITRRKQEEQALRVSEEKYRSIFENAVEGIFQVATDGHFISANPAMARIYGDASPEETIARITDIEQVYVDHRERRRYHDLLEKYGTVNNFESQFYRKDGAVIWLSINARTVKDGAGKTLYYEGTVEDITQRKNAEQRLLESEERYRTAIENSNDGVSLVRGSHLIYVNQKFLEIYGYEKPDEAVGRNIDFTVHPDDRRIVIERNLRRQRGEQVISKYEFKGIRKDGTTVYIEISTTRIIFHEEPATLAFHRDVTKRKMLEQKLQAISITDELTGLYNRRGFFILSLQQLKLARRTGKNALLFFADLDKLKWINDTLGHQVGDAALFETARILRDTFRDSDIISRVGGDEFAVLAIDINNETAQILLDRLQAFLNTYNGREKRKYFLSLSVGVARFDPRDPVSLDVLISRADTLMYEEKRKKRGREGEEIGESRIP
jgi:diguanylate cyclase (GGDEF)-like protein/PAS domain S-box-containing protein